MQSINVLASNSFALAKNKIKTKIEKELLKRSPLFNFNLNVLKYKFNSKQS